MAETGFLDRTLVSAGERYRYQVFVPADFTLSQSWPVILFLHGAGERGTDGLRPTDVGIGSAIRRNASRFPAIVVFPQAHPDSEGWRGPTAAAALHALDRTVAEFHGDPLRLYLTGLSMGGSGTLRVAAEYPGRFAALVPICPDFDGELTRPRSPDGGATDPYRALAQAVGDLPIWIFQGEDDEDPPPAVTRHLVRVLQQHPAEVRYTEYPHVGHNAWDRAYAEAGLIPWLLAQHRSPSPAPPVA